jgi:hypothetical protein
LESRCSPVFFPPAAPRGSIPSARCELDRSAVSRNLTA